jgi:ribosomal protein S18 acetylase RimI-like enzyme
MSKYPINEIVFRKLTVDDVGDVQRVALEAWRHTYKNIFEEKFIDDFIASNYSPDQLARLVPEIQSGQMFFHVAEISSSIVGFCNTAITDQGVKLWRIYVLPQYIGKGIGHRLLELSERFVVDRGFKDYSCLVHKNNDLGKRFYMKQGFKHINAKDVDDEWYMEKTLQRASG